VVAASNDYEWPLGKAWWGPPNVDIPDGVGPWLVRPAPALDGDGTPYLVWACRPSVWASPWLLAVSAKDGTVKWWYRSGHLDAQKVADLPAVGVVCPPLAEDVDGDGQPDLVATFGTVYQGKLPPWVATVSRRA